MEVESGHRGSIGAIESPYMDGQPAEQDTSMPVPESEQDVTAEGTPPSAEQRVHSQVADTPSRTEQYIKTEPESQPDLSDATVPSESVNQTVDGTPNQNGSDDQQSLPIVTPEMSMIEKAEEAADNNTPIQNHYSLPPNIIHHEMTEANFAGGDGSFKAEPFDNIETSPHTFNNAHSFPLLTSDTVMTDLSYLEPEAPRIQAFAKLEFDDGQFYMNTYSVELGRDIRAARMAFQRDMEAGRQGDGKVRGHSSSAGNASQTPLKREGSTRVAGSVVSESGGIMGVDTLDPGREGRRKKKKSKKSKSTSSSSNQLSRKNSTILPNPQTDYQSLAMASIADSTVGAHPVDPLSLLPSPDECPLIPIHPPSATAAGHKGISRKHVKISFNFKKHLFEVEIKGKNGAFVDDEWYAAGKVIALKSGSYIQIGGVGVRFVLPDVALGETGAEQNERREHGIEARLGQEDDYSTENSSEADQDAEEVADEQDGEQEGDEDAEAEEEDEVEQEDELEEEVEEDAEDEDAEGEAEEVQPEPVTKAPPLKRGPGRPPKNGIMSKREQARLKREEKIRAQQRGGKVTSGKSSKSLKTPKGAEGEANEDQAAKPEKRKYTKRKGVKTEDSEQPEDAEQLEGGQDNGEQKMPKEPKPPKPPKRPRSPSPVFDEASLTPEQLAKPSASYVVLIHEALSNSTVGPMSLPQIYRAIERKYPYFKLRVQTTGWQSSVRHNLSQHHAFCKVERDGKGWLWDIVPGISIEKERRRKASPPPMQYLPQHPTPYQYHPPLYQPPLSIPGAMGPPPLNATSSAIGTSPHASSLQPSQQTHTQPGPAGILPHLANPILPSSNTYSSPYANPPPKPQPPQQGTQPQQTVQQSQRHSTQAPASLPPVVNSSQPQAPTGPAQPHNGTPGYHANMPHPGQHQPPQPTRPQAQPLRPVQAPRPQPATNEQGISKDILAAVGRFKAALVNSMPDKVRAEALVTSAINRSLGLSDRSSLPKEDPQEQAIMKAVTGLLENIRQRRGQATGSPAPQQQQVAQPAQQPHQQQRPMPPPASPSQSNTPGSVSSQNSAAQGQSQKPSTATDSTTRLSPNAVPQNRGAQQQLLQYLQQQIDKQGKPTGSPPKQTGPSPSPAPASSHSSPSPAPTGQTITPINGTSPGGSTEQKGVVPTAGVKRSASTDINGDGTDGTGQEDGPERKREKVEA